MAHVEIVPLSLWASSIVAIPSLVNLNSYLPVPANSSHRQGRPPAPLSVLPTYKMVKAEGCLLELIVQLLARFLVTATVIVITRKLDLRPRGSIIRCSRGIQNSLHLSWFACTFTEADGDTRIGAWIATATSYLLNPGPLLVFAKRNVLDPLAAAWLGLAQSKRRRLLMGGSGGYITTGAR